MTNPFRPLMEHLEQTTSSDTIDAASPTVMAKFQDFRLTDSIGESSPGSAAPPKSRTRQWTDEASASDQLLLPQAIVWMDLEMTGLDPDKDHILQIACLVTSGRLDEVVEGPELTICQSNEILGSMNEWCIQHHGASGLTQMCRESGMDMATAEEQVLRFVQRHASLPAQLAGNSIYMDLAFMKKRMPRLAQCFHHRLIDVSSLSELARRWYPRDAKRAPRSTVKQKHTALSDIRSSVSELKFYRRTIFK